MASFLTHQAIDGHVLAIVARLRLRQALQRDAVKDGHGTCD